MRRSRKWRRKRPLCEIPNAMAWRGLLAASGELGECRRNEMRSRTAAKAMPVTREFVASYQNS